MAIPWGSAMEEPESHSADMSSVESSAAPGVVPEPSATLDSGSGLSPRATAVTAFAATLAGFGIVAAHGLDGQGLTLAFAGAVLVVLAAIDLDRRLIPNKIVLPAAALVFAGQLVFEPGHWVQWIVAPLAAAAFFGAAHAIYPAGIGMGDVKLALLLGAALGWDVLNGLLIGSLLAAAFGLYLIVKEGAAARKQTIPFGPFLAAGALAILLFG